MSYWASLVFSRDLGEGVREYASLADDRRFLRGLGTTYHPVGEEDTPRWRLAFASAASGAPRSPRWLRPVVDEQNVLHIVVQDHLFSFDEYDANSFRLALTRAERFYTRQEEAPKDE